MGEEENKTNDVRKNTRSGVNLAKIVLNVAKAAHVDAIICTTETGAFAKQLHRLSDQFRVIAATTNGETYDVLTQANMDCLRLPIRAADKYRQARYVISVAFRAHRVSLGDFVVCAIGPEAYQDEGDLVVIADVEPGIENVAVPDLLRLTDGIRPRALEAAITVACKIGRAARRGKRIGAIFTLGDSIKVLEGAKQLIPNPFRGHEDAVRMLTNPDIHDAVVELAKLDGAFVVRGDGFIQTAGAFLAPSKVEIELPSGLGARHFAAASVTARTDATAVVVSSTDGNVRVFSDGALVLQIDPDVSYGPITVDE